MMMKAIICPRYGPPEVLELAEIAKPMPKDDEILVKVLAASVNAADWHLMRADPFLTRLMVGLFSPKGIVLGADVCGRIESVGRNVTQFDVGDVVFGDLSDDGLGAYAEYVAAPAKLFIRKSAEITPIQAAAIPLAAITALQALRKGNLQAGQHVMVHGSSGGVGTFAVQIAKAMGAQVTAVCSTQKVEQARMLGADHVIDYKKEDFSQSEQRYDLILGIGGSHSPAKYRDALTSAGHYVMVGGSNGQIFKALLMGPLLALRGNRKLSACTAKSNAEDLTFVQELVEAGKVRPVIDRCYPLNEVPDAIRYLESGQATGKVIISLMQDKKA